MEKAHAEPQSLAPTSSPPSYCLGSGVHCHGRRGVLDRARTLTPLNHPPAEHWHHLRQEARNRKQQRRDIYEGLAVILACLAAALAATGVFDIPIWE